MASPFRGYLKETRRPIYTAALLLPFFVTYHVGTVVLRTTYINGADALILRILRPLPVPAMFASALVLVALFVVWQVRTRGSWTIHTAKLALLYLESFAFAGLLFLIFGWLSVHWNLSVPARPHEGRIASLVLFCGAGIYEELLFRGVLLGALLIAFEKLLGLRPATAALCGTLTAAAVFSLFHYVGPAADVFTVRSFVDRMLAGLYFSALFVTRGFGVAAAAHALYDMLVGLVFIFA
jgi:membrane protease YdiL (CAAX protease family)